MGLTTALYTSLSGLDANSQAITVTGNNIANVNTTAYKSSRISFETQISELISGGSGPSAEAGGTNPIQVGLGTRIGSVTRNFENGSLQTTGVNTDLAVEGNGFFVVDLNGTSHYTRAGNFSLDADFRLVNSDGGLVQGYSVDENFDLIDGVLGNIRIPLGTQTLAQKTETIKFSGVLNSGGDPATQGSLHTADAIYSDATATAPALATDALDSLFDVDGNMLFETGDIVTVTDARKGGTTIPTKTFEVGPDNTTASDAHGTSLQEMMDFFRDLLGIDTDVNGGVSIDVDGVLNFEGNIGEDNNLSLDTSSIFVNKDTPDQTNPFMIERKHDSDDTSAATTVVAFDSLGNELVLGMSIVYEDRSDLGTTWRFMLQSEDDSDLSPVLGNGSAVFDTNGRLVTLNNSSFTIDRNDTGAFTPQIFEVEFDDPDNAVSAVNDGQGTSQITAFFQDGFAGGTLDDFTFDPKVGNGEIVGLYSNGTTKVLGQVPLASFVNPLGLREVSGNLYRETLTSGIASVVKANTAGTGRVIGGALELANVDLSQEFINLITASTGFTANSRVFSTSERLIQELLATIR